MTKEVEIPWAEGPWKTWALDRGIKLPGIIIDKKTPRYASLKAIENFEKQLKLTTKEHLEMYGELPMWATGLATRDYDHVLTPSRHRTLPGYIVRDFEPDFMHDLNAFRRTGAWMIEPDYEYHKRLHECGIWLVEKELFRSRGNRLLAYRFLDKTGKTSDVASIRWDRGGNTKVLRKESFVQDSGSVVISEIHFEDSPELPKMIKYGTDLEEWRAVDHLVLAG